MGKSVLVRDKMIFFLNLNRFSIYIGVWYLYDDFEFIILKKMTMVIESDIIMVDEGVDQSRPGATYL